MLNKKEEAGCQKMLAEMPDAELMALAETVTKKQVKLSGIAEATKAILTYSESAEDLLRRQKVKKEVLQRYLRAEEVKYPIFNEDKAGLIRIILKLWSSKQRDREQVDSTQPHSMKHHEAQPSTSKMPPSPNRAPASSQNDSSGRSRTTLKRKVKTEGACGSDTVPPHHHKFKASAKQDVDKKVYVKLEDKHDSKCSTKNLEPALDSSLKKKSQSCSTHSSEQKSSDTITVNINIRNYDRKPIIKKESNVISETELRASSNREAAVNEGSRRHLKTDVNHSKVVSSADSNTVSSSSKELVDLGQQFARWFYENLNSHNPAMEKPPQDFGPQHFWDDCQLVLSTETSSMGCEVEKFSGSSLVAKRFLAFSSEELLLFNANISSEGVFTKSDPHGLVMLLVCGTIHRNNECLGTFQQTFGIIKDPRLENTWKIKTTSMKVRSSQVTAIPKLDANKERQLAMLTYQ